MKTIKAGNLELELTPERRQRVENAIIETSEKLEYEMSFSEDLRNEEQIEFYRSHIETLEDMLN